VNRRDDDRRRDRYQHDQRADPEDAAPDPLSYLASGDHPDLAQ
jgi:hypothetical protein